MSKAVASTLYLYTKEYPFRRLEKYIDHELPVLSKRFDRVVIVPSEFFAGTDSEKPTSTLPANVEVYDLNGAVKSSGITAKSVLFQAFFIWCYEYIVNPYRKYQVRYFRKNLNILLYQLISAKVMSAHLKKQATSKNYFYTYWYHHSTLMLAAMKRKGQIGSFVSRAHSIDLYNEEWKFIDDDHKPLPYYRFKLKHIDKVFAISEHGQQFLLAKYPQYKEKIEQSYLGVPDNGLNPESGENVFTVVTCSIFNDNKRVFLVAETLAKLNGNIHWVHFGAGGDNPDKVMQAVAKLPANVRADLRGSVANAEVISFYRSNNVNLLLNLSLAEGVPVAIMEAISFGIPIIATKVYGTPELLSNENGFLISTSATADEIAELIGKIRSDRALENRMRKNSRDLFLQKFFSEKTVNSFVDGLVVSSSAVENSATG